MKNYEPVMSFGEEAAAAYDDAQRFSKTPSRRDRAAAVVFLEKLARGGPALELAVGTGWIALPLAGRGIRVDGVDISPAMVAQLRAKPGGDQIAVTMGDFADVPVSGAYRLIFVVANTLFNLLTQDDQVRCFENVAAHLTDDGAFLVEAFRPDFLYRLRDNQYVDAEAVEVDEVRLDVARHDPLEQLLEESHVLLSREGVRLNPIVTRYAWPSELDLMARIAGLHLKERWAGWNREPYTSTSRYAVSVYGREAAPARRAYGEGPAVVAARKMHADELDTDVTLVGRLLAAQFPQWADLPLERVESAGTDNALYRLGEDMVVRMPRIHWAIGQVEKEHRWLPRLAPHLPLAVPVPLAMGQPADGYPWQWSVCPWIEGENPSIERLADPCQAATDLAGFVAALQRIDTAGAPRSGRGEPLATRDQYTRDAIAALHGLVDTDAVTAAWEADLRAPEWDRPPVWIHGDIAPGNLLAVDGRLRAVIDWDPGLGDPAVELIVAWNLLAGESRDVFRTALGVDEATWTRGRGWALSIALIQLPYYLDTNPVMVAGARHVIAEVLADHASGL